MASPDRQSFNSRYGARPVLSLDRGELLGVGFFAVLSAGLMFALGFAAGRRPVVGGAGVASLRHVDDKHELHKELSQQPTQVEMTFHNFLTEKEQAKKAAQRPAPDAIAPGNLAYAPTGVGSQNAPVAAAAPVDAAPAEPVAAPQPERTAEATLDAVADKQGEAAKPSDKKLARPSDASLATVKSAPPAAPTKPAVRGAFTVQVGSFKTDSEARGMARKLEQKGYAASVVSSSLGAKGNWYRVRVGTFSSDVDARSMKAKLDRDRFSGWVVKAD